MSFYSNIYILTLTISHPELNLLHTPFYEVNNRPEFEYERSHFLPTNSNVTPVIKPENEFTGI